MMQKNNFKIITKLFETRKKTLLAIFFALTLTFLITDFKHVDGDLAIQHTTNLEIPSEPKIAASGNSVYVVWKKIISGQPGELYFKKSLDGGLTFGSSIKLEAQDAYQFDVSGYGNTMYVAWSQMRCSTSLTCQDSLNYQRSTDGGTSFEITKWVNSQATGYSNPIGLIQIIQSGNDAFIVFPDSATQLSQFIHIVDGTIKAQKVLYASAPLPNKGSTNPQIALSGSNILVVWEHGFEVLFQKFQMISTTVLGPQYSQPIMLVPVNLSNTPALSKNPVIAAVGNNIYLAWVEGYIQNWRVYLVKSTDGGSSWTEPMDLGTTSKDVVSSIIGNAGLEIAASGNSVYVAWADNIKISTDSGETFSSITGMGIPSYLAASGSNVFLVGKNGADIVAMTSNNGGNTFSSNILTTLEGLGWASPTIISSAAATDPNLYVAWFNAQKATLAKGTIIPSTSPPGSDLGIANPPSIAPSRPATSITVQPSSTSVTLGDFFTVTATLRDNTGSPLSGRIVTFLVSGLTGSPSAITAADGTAGPMTFIIPLTATTGSVTVTASFTGDSTFLPSSTTASINIVSSPSSGSPGTITPPSITPPSITPPIQPPISPIQPPTQGTLTLATLQDRARLWSASQMSDSEFGRGINEMVTSSLIGIPSAVDYSSLRFPGWFKNVAFWFANSQIEYADYLFALEWMINNGIAKSSTGIVNNNLVTTQTNSGSSSESVGILNLDKDVYQITNSQGAMVKVSGKVKNFIGGLPIILIILKPDQSSFEITTPISNKGEFSTIIGINPDNPVGTYSINAKHNDLSFDTALFTVMKK